MVKTIVLIADTESNRATVFECTREKPENTKEYNQIHTAGDIGTAVKDWWIEHGETEE